MAISARVAEYMKSASWIRRMFEQGAALKREHGAENVYDFSLGNPDLPPPPAFSRALQAVAAEVPGVHRYMPNAGFPETRARVAERVASQHGVDPGAAGVIMTVGAAGALNVILKACLDPGNEVVVPVPYFPEYRFYVDNHGGVLRTVPTTAEFDLDLDAFEDALNENTRIVLVNSPNNPTGRVYSAETLRALGELMQRKCPAATLVSDEPYRQIVYDGFEVPSVLGVTPMSVVATSFSKDLGLAGERIGYLAVHPDHPDREGLLAAAVFVNRTLGFVNAPALMQRVIARLEEVTVDLEVYAERRKVFLAGLRDAGYECVTPEGAFYLFPRSPLADDVAFVRALLEERILVVPGTGFGQPGYVRLSYAVETDTIHRALPGFRRVLEKIRQG
ncbi:MAG: pyridoxal phosphate-dependent aminotransferase [Planctomycetes bacterium]|nr:pyridoxal phosphate-dependent aminotransferase [Planctomycetota bacterium]